MTSRAASFLNNTREPDRSVISTSSARIKDTTSDQRMSDGVGLANTRSSVRRCLERNVAMPAETGG